MSEPDIHLRQDYRQEWICVSLASRGERQPFIESSYRIYGSHPDDVWPKIMAQRKAKLGWEFDLWYFENGTMRSDVVIPDYDRTSQGNHRGTLKSSVLHGCRRTQN